MENISNFNSILYNNAGREFVCNINCWSYRYIAVNNSRSLWSIRTILIMILIFMYSFHVNSILICTHFWYFASHWVMRSINGGFFSYTESIIILLPSIASMNNTIVVIIVNLFRKKKKKSNDDERNMTNRPLGKYYIFLVLLLTAARSLWIFKKKKKN